MDIVLQTMTRDEARECIDSINAHLGTARARLLDLYEREGWRALGYESWRACAVAEFQQSQARVYQLLKAAEIERELSTNVEIGVIPEGQLRPLAQLETAEERREAYAQARELSPNGHVTAAHVQSVVNTYKAPTFTPNTDEAPEAPERDDWWDDEPADMASPVAATPSPIFVPAPSPATNPLAALFSSESPDWHTPAHIVEAVCAVLGTIDLDPCSNSHAIPNVPALTLYTATDNGLAHEWAGRVFVNPPWSREQPIGDWILKLTKSHRDGDVPEAIALVPNNTDTRWWELLADFPVCFIRRRLKFLSPDEDAVTSSATFGSAVVYLGPDVERFARVFDALGATYQRVR